MLNNESKSSSLVFSLIALILLSGCVQKQYKPTKTSLELQAIQSTEFETSYKIAFASTLSVFQDLGYIISTADSETGFVTASSPRSQELVIFRGQVMKNRKATAFVEGMPSKMIRVRLNFVDEEESSTGYGMKGANAIPVEDPKLYQETFEKIQKAIFVRTNR
jgi:hypothetical protein